MLRGGVRTRDGRVAQGAHDRPSVGSGYDRTEPDQRIPFDLGVLGLFLLDQVSLVEDLDSVGDVGSVLSSEDDLRLIEESWFRIAGSNRPRGCRACPGLDLRYYNYLSRSSPQK